jgi:hypothetical protein
MDIPSVTHGNPAPMLHPHTEVRFIHPAIGYGVVATRLIPRGTIVWALDVFDQQFTAAQVVELDAIHRAIIEKYAYVDGRGFHVLCWDNARFFNHHCEANCLGAGFEFEIAIRDIHPGEQLTDDYGGLNCESAFPCSCGSAVCRGIVRPDDVLRLSDRWDDELREVFPLIRTVTQPLWPVVRNKESVESVIDGRAGMVSSRLHYFAHDVDGHAT